MKWTFHEHCKTGLYTPKFHLWDYSVEDPERSGSIDVLNSSPFED